MSDRALRVDLHTHSTASDGLYAPSDLLQQAHAAGLDVLALTDHDTTEGVAEASEAGAALGIRVVPGLELNTELPDQRGEAHLLGYFVETERQPMQDVLLRLRESRERRGERMVAQLRAAGMEIEWERVRALAGGAVGRPHVARALVERGYATSIGDAFERLLRPGAPGFVPRARLTTLEGIRLMKSARGIPVLAHPARLPQLGQEVVPALVIAGLMGLECYYGDYTEETVASLVDLADRYGLIPTGGSDYHGPGIHPTPLGGRAVPASSFERLERTSVFLRQLPAPAFTPPPGL